MEGFTNGMAHALTIWVFETTGAPAYCKQLRLREASEHKTLKARGEGRCTSADVHVKCIHAHS